MPQIELSDQDIQKVDDLVKNGVFHSRENAIKTILESISFEELKRMESARHEVDMFLEISMGNMLYAGVPLKVIIDGRDMYKIPVKSVSNKMLNFFYLYVDQNTLEVDAHFLTDLRSLPEMSDEEQEKIKKVQIEANNYCQNIFNKLVAGIPLKDVLEVEKGFKECFRIPLIGEYEDKVQICGYLFLDTETLAIVNSTIYKNY